MSKGTKAMSGLKVGSVLEDGGVVFGEDGGDWLVVAPASKRIIKPWGLYATDTSLPNTSGSVGSPTKPNDMNSSKYNTSTLTSNEYSATIDAFGNVGCPAAEYCRTLGYDLPNASDLQLIYDNRVAIDATDTTEGPTLSVIEFGNMPEYGTTRVWTSSEYNSYSAWMLYFSNGNWYYSYKHSICWVVPFKRIHIQN
jgi:hypothetical protein